MSLISDKITWRNHIVVVYAEVFANLVKALFGQSISSSLAPPASDVADRQRDDNERYRD